MEEEGILVRADDLEPAGKSFFRLYFKGLVSNETTKLAARFVVAICGDEDDLLFDTKGPIHDSNITLLEAELIALKCGLTEAVSMQIKHISICCDQDQIFNLVMGRSIPEQENIALLMRDVQGIRKHLTSSIPVMVTPHQVKHAMQTISSDDMIIDIPSSDDIVIDIPDPKETCTICTKDDINADQMFSVVTCGHKYCVECVKRHIEARLLVQGTSLVTCLEYQCQSMLSYISCMNILTPELKEMWGERMREDLIPVTDRVYCPNPRCSALVFETEFSHQLVGVRRFCVKCGESFCINCKVPWHNDLSCYMYKSLHRNPTDNDRILRDLAKEKMWRQCRKYQHMIELSSGCISMTCRCGHEFCYYCGADAGRCRHGHGLLLTDDVVVTQDCCRCCCWLFFWVVIAIVVVVIIIVLVKRFSSIY